MPVNPTLPTPGGDDGTWGDELNAALGVIVAGVNAEETARAAADTALDGRLDVLEAKPDNVTTSASDLTSGTLDVARLADGSVTEAKLSTAVQTKINTVGAGTTDSRVVSGTVAGQVLVWDTADNRYEPVTPTDAVAADVPFTPAGGIAATNVQAALVELDSEKATTGHSHTAQGISVQDENGTAVTSVTLLDFQGAGVTAAAGAAGEVVVTIPGGGSGTALTVQDEGSALATDATTLNFVGAGVTASGTGATKTITIPGGGGSAERAAYPQPSDFGLLAWTANPFFVASNNTNVTASGRQHLTRVYLPAGTVTNVTFGVRTAGATFSGGNEVGLYDASGNLLGKTADLAATFGSTGTKTVPFASPIVVTAGYYYVAVLNTSTTMVAFSAALGDTVSGLAQNMGTTSTRAAYIMNTVQASLPASYTLSSSSPSANPFFFGLS